jgi:dynein heavy chain
MYNSILDNKVPGMWEAKAYPSLKPLSSWISNLDLRVEFIKNWLIVGKPVSYWISSFFFPQGFLTAVL